LLYRYSEIFRTLLILADLLLVAGAWLGAYWLRFHTMLPVPRGVPELALYLPPLAVILPVCFAVFRAQRLYEPRRTESMLPEAGLILRASAISVVLLVALSFFVRETSYSRGVVAIFSLLAPGLIISLRSLLRGSLRIMRRRGYNRRFVLVIGGGRLAEEIIERIHAHPEAGLHVHGVLADGPRGPRPELGGTSVLTSYGGLKDVLRTARVDQVIIALPREEWGALEKIFKDLDDEMVSVKLAPDLLHIMTLRSSVESLDGLPIINLREGPMVGWAVVQKRAFDIVLTSIALLLGLPLMGLIALAILASSGRPILYTQRRTGIDGRAFTMWKFRTMHEDAEQGNRPVWTQRDDPRRTRLGQFLRRFSLDELPQLVNVLRGEMSLVGPRPERPHLIEEFRGEIPGYMLRLKVKAGLTGWAQIHGWRGDTSLQERVEHDIYYIQNWSPALDLWIVLRTLSSAILGRNAY